MSIREFAGLAGGKDRLRSGAGDRSGKRRGNRRRNPLRRRRLLAERLEARHLLTAEFVLDTVVDAQIVDVNHDGVFDQVIENNTSISIRNFDIGLNLEEVAVFEFDTTTVPRGAGLNSVDFEFDVNSFTSSTIVYVEGYVGDGVATLGDATSPAVSLATLTQLDLSLGRNVVSIDPALLAAPMDSGNVTIRIRGELNSANMQVGASESTFDMPAALRVNFDPPPGVTELPIVASSDAEIIDSQPRDGVFDSIDSVSGSMNARNINSMTTMVEEVAVAEFDTSAVPSGAEIVSVTLDIRVVAYTSNTEIVLEGFSGDGVITLADATAGATELAALDANDLDLAVITIPINPALVESAIRSGNLTIRGRGLPTANMSFATSERPGVPEPPTLNIGYLTPPTIDLASLTIGDGTVIHGDEDVDLAGRSVSGAGDVNGDGFDDFLIGAAQADGVSNLRTSSGESYLIFGGPSLPATIDLSSSLGSAGVTIYGDDSHDWSGYSVTSGDFTGDGLDDLLIGAPDAGIPGKAYLIYGKTNWGSSIDLRSLPFTDGLTITGIDFPDDTGFDVANAGDVDGDGRSDLLIGAPQADGPNNTRSNAGDTYLIYGRSFNQSDLDLSSPSPGVSRVIIHGAVAGSQSGLSVSSAGDLNGDGLADLVTGAATLAGESYVIFGSAFLPDTIDLATPGSADTIIQGIDNDDQSYEVSPAGDVNGDGIDDLLIGAAGGDGPANADTDAGESYVIFGATALPTTINLGSLGAAGITIHGIDPGDGAGTSVSGGGDVNGDGYDDLLIAAAGGDGENNLKSEVGESYVVLGDASLPAVIDLAGLGTSGVTIFGIDDDDGHQAISHAGDVNGDGFDDLLIGSRFADGPANSELSAGEAYLIYGRDFTGEVTHPGTTADDTLSGDAAANVIIGGEGADVLIAGGGADVLRGGEGDDVLAIEDMTFRRLVGGNGFDTLRLDAVDGDLDLSGIADNRILGIEQIDIRGAGDNTLDLDPRLVRTMSDESNTVIVRSDPGDTVNIGSFWATRDIERIGGEFFQVYSNNLAFLKVQLHEFVIDLQTMTDTLFNGADSGDNSGVKVTKAGDVNGDGFDDLLIVSEYGDGPGNSGSNEGEAYLVFGPSSGGTRNLGTPGHWMTIYGVPGADGIRSASGGGDINGDGFDDIVIGSDSDSRQQTDAGTVSVIFGSDSLPSTIQLASLGAAGVTIFADDAMDSFGSSLDSSGDVNGDGYADLLIGAGLADGPANGRPDAGDSYLFFGGDALPAAIDLNAGASPDVIFHGAESNDGSGSRVTIAGDINGDGFDDVLIGADQADGAGNGRSNSGESYLVFGGVSLPAMIDFGTPGSADMTVFGASADDQSGGAVSGAGDVNGDGFDDLIIGAPYADGPGETATNSGESYLIFGSATPPASIDLALPSAAFVTFYGAEDSDFSGIDVSGGGDVNGDGLDDLLIGASGGDGITNTELSAGQAALVFGKTSFPSTVNLDNLGLEGVTIFGPRPSAEAGASVAIAGDYSGDGFDDLLIGAPGTPANGASHLVLGLDFLGTATDLGNSIENEFTGDSDPQVMIGGRADDTLAGGGGADVLIGAEGDDLLTVGDLSFSRVVGGNGIDVLELSTFSTTLDLTAIADNRIQGIEQINAAGAGPNTLTLDAQEVLNISDHSNTLIVRIDSDDTLNIGAGWTQEPNEPIGSGFYEVFTQGAATLKVFTSRTFNLAALDPADGVVFYGDDVFDNSGLLVSGAGDVNGDGYEDFLIGAEGGSRADNNTSRAGETYLIFGGPTLGSIDLAALGSAGTVIYGVDSGDFSGDPVSGAGDVNGDGFDDLLIGAPFADGPDNLSTSSGESYVVYGGPSLPQTIDLATPGTAGLTVYGEAGDRSGTAVGAAGDVNGDGFADLLIGATEVGGTSGAAFLIYGGTSLPSSMTLSSLGTSGVQILGKNGGDRVGYSVSTAGDVNGDGYDDLWIGPQDADPNGESYLIYGGPGLPDTIMLGSLGAAGVTFVGIDVFDTLGQSVSSGGDINGDGFDDLLVGATGGDGIPNGSVISAGEAYIIYGSDSLPQMFDMSTLGTGGVVIYGIDNADRLGEPISGAGDINGDGYDDLLISAWFSDGAANANDWSGEAYVVFGGPSLPSSIELETLGPAAGFTVFGGEEGDNSAVSVGVIGDTNGDGFDEILIGADRADGISNARQNSGETYLIFGQDFTGAVTHAGTTAADTLVGDASANVMVGGDDDDQLSGNGGADVLIGGPGDDVAEVGDLNFIRVDGGRGFDTLQLDPAITTLDLTAFPDNRIVDIEQIDLRSGGTFSTLTLDLQEVLNISDESNTLIVRRNPSDAVNIGSGWTQGPNETIGTEVFEVFTQGEATLKVLLPTTIDLAALTADQGTIFYGNYDNDRSGFAVSSPGDVNGDGFDDVLISGRLGDAGFDDAESYLIFGGPTMPATVDLTSLGSAGITIVGTDNHGSLPIDNNSLSGGDINGDGYDDLVIGSRYSNSTLGYVFVIFGGASLPSTIDLASLGSGGVVIDGVYARNRLGVAVSSTGDVNGDGFHDLLIGAAEGFESYLIFGGSSMPTTIDIRDADVVISGVSDFDFLGNHLSIAGDVNGDGFNDLVIAQHLGDGPGDTRLRAGETYVIYGSMSLPSAIDVSIPGSVDVIIYGATELEFSGHFLEIAGDVNGDGIDDILLPTSASAGPTRLIFGGASLPSIIDLASVSADVTFAFTGRVGRAGDVNGDGFDDLLMANRWADGPGGTRPDAGETYLIFGAPALPPVVDDTIGLGITIFGIDEDDHSGQSISGFGDVNGDGFDDLLIGAPYAHSLANARPEAGESYLLFGGDFTAAVTHQGTDGPDTLTGDATANVMIGGRDDDELIGNGGADVLRGGEGDDVLAISDLNFDRIVGGNGVDTLRLDTAGATLDLPSIPNNRFVGIEQIDIRGSGSNALNLNLQEVLYISDESNTLLVRKDGDDSVSIGSGWTQQPIEMIGDDYFNVFAQGAAVLKVQLSLEIDLGTLTPSQGTIIYGAQAGDYSGFSVSDAGDFNADGFDDLLIGAPLVDGFTGASYLIFGGPTMPATIDLASLGSAGIMIQGAIGGDSLGSTVSAAGDINADGFDDIAIYERASGARGATYIFFGEASPTDIDLSTPGIADVVIRGLDDADRTGSYLSNLGDVNGDGFDDLLLGAYSADSVGNARNSAGEAYLLFGGDELPSSINLAALGSLGATIFGAEDFNRLARGMGSAGDVNGDGFEDLVIGVPNAYGVSPVSQSAGQSLVFFGGPTFPTSIDLAADMADVTIYGTDNADLSGRSVNGHGDVNGDGFDDLLIGAFGGNGPTNTDIDRGDAYVVFGGATLPASIDLATGGADVTVYGIDDNDQLGRIVDIAGDVNGDGFDDLLIGAPGADGKDNAELDAGEYYLIFGGSSLPAVINADSIGILGLTIFGADAGDSNVVQGFSISRAGDANGDGFDDLMIGVVLADAAGNAKEDAGESYLLYGSDFLSQVTHAGTSVADTLIGDAAANIMVGGTGDDELDGNGGADVQRGGEGDDVLAIDDLLFDRIVGGNGFDTLRLDSAGETLDLTAIPDNRIMGIEQINIDGSGTNTLRLDLMEVLNISDESNTLIVRRGGEDPVSIGAGWMQAADETIGVDDFAVFTQGTATLKIQTSPLLTISGKVFEDLVGNGSFDGADSGIENATLRIFLDGGDGEFGSDGQGSNAGSGQNGDDDTIITTLQTDLLGDYALSVFEEGTFFVQPQAPDGYTALTQFLTVVGTAGAAVIGQDFGLAVPGSIDGFKFEDINNNGVYDSAIDVPQAGVTFTISGTDSAGNVISETKTSDANGEFRFPNLLPSVNGAGSGTGYTITETVPDGQLATTSTSVTVDLESRQSLAAFAGQADLFSQAPLVLDTSFGSGGVATQTTDSVVYRSVALQEDGKVVVTGAPSGREHVITTRFNIDGSIDTGFGVGGNVVTDLSVDDDYTNTVITQPDGKIIIAGATGTEAFFSRLNSDGSFDTSFGTGGTFVVTGGGTESVDEVNDLVLQDDGKILFTGLQRSNAVVGRLNTDGTLDATFGTGGLAVPPSGGIATGNAIALQDDGKVIIVIADIGGPVQVARYDSSGVLDPSFGTAGIASADITGAAGSYGVVIGPNGKITVSAGVNNPLSRDIALARFNTDGSLDPSFGTGGITVGDSGNNDFPLGSQVGLLAGNRLMVVGRSGPSSGGFTVFSPDGSLLQNDYSTSATPWTRELAVLDEGTVYITGSRFVERYSSVLGVEVVRGSELMFGNLRSDFGDAPDSYLTTLGVDGAHHLAIGPTLGSQRDTEDDAQLPLDGSGDGAGEDGVSFGTIEAASSATVTINVQGSNAMLDAWVDFDGDGTWGAGEQIFTSETVSIGDNVLAFDVPFDADTGGSYARFRLSTAGGLDVDGMAANGEVEDYAITIEPDTTRPMPVITGPTNPTNSDPFDVTIDFGEPVTDFVAGDIIVGGGTVTDWVDNGDGVFTATIDASADGSVSVNVAANVADDRAGNANLAATTYSVDVDTTSPTPVITGPSDPTNSDPFTVMIDFGEAVNGFIASGITVGGGSVTNLIDDGGGQYRAVIDAAGDGLLTVDLAAGVADDLAGNPSLAATTYSVTVDATVPTPVITGPSSPTNMASFDVTIDFGETVFDFVSGDVSVSGGVINGFTNDGNGVFTATIDASGDGTVTVNVGAAVATDVAGNDNLAATQLSIDVDTTSPTPTIAGPASPTNSDPLEVTIDFGEPVNDFVAADITVAGGSVTNLVDNGGGSYTATIDASSDGTVTVDVAASIASDDAGNDNLAATQFSVDVDTSLPAPLISGPASPSNEDPFEITIDFGESVNGFVSGDVNVNGGLITGFVDDGDGIFRLTIDADADSTVTVDVAADVATDDAGNTNLAATRFSIEIDTAAPTPTITGPSDPTNTDPFDVTIQFAETVTGFESTDIVVSGGSVTNLVDNGNGEFTATINAAGDGTVTVSIPASAASDLAGNDSLAATQYSIDVDTTAPVPVISGPASPTNSDPLQVTIEFGEMVGGFMAGDIAITGGSVTQLVDNGNGIFTATVDANQDGALTINLPAGVASDLAGNSSLAATQFAIDVDTSPPAPTITGPVGTTNTSPFDVTIDFGETVSGFVTTDISISGGTVANLVAGAGGVYTATINAADGNLTIDLPAGVASDDAGNDNEAASQYSVLVDTTAPTPLISGPADPISTTSFSVAVDFGEVVGGFVFGDLQVTGGTVAGIVDSGNGRFDLNINAAGDGVVQIEIPANAATDGAGNQSLAAVPFSLLIDTVSPVPVISGPVGITSDDPLELTIDFGESVTGFIAADILVGGGNVIDLVDQGGGVFTATVDVTVNGTVSVEVPAGVATDQVGLANEAAVSYSVVVDAVSPTPTISGPSSPHNNDPFDVTIAFDESVSGFDESDIQVSGGVVSSLTDNGGGSYTATINASGDGNVSVDVPAGAASDDAGNLSVAATSFGILIDTTGPTPLISGPDSPGNSSRFDLTVDFGEPVSGFLPGDIVVTDGGVSRVTSQGGGVFTVSVNAADDGPLTVDILAGAVSDPAGNSSPAASFMIDIDTSRPTVSVTGPVSPINVDAFDVAITFSEDVSALQLGDIAISGGTVSNLIDGGGGSYTATVSAAGDGTVMVDIPADVVADDAGNGNDASSQLVVVVDTTSPTPFVDGPLAPTNSDPFEVAIDFGEVVTGFLAGDVMVTGGSIIGLTDDGDGSFTATIDAAADGDVFIEVPAGVAVDLAGNQNSSSGQTLVVVDTTPPMALISGPDSPHNSEPFTVTIDFGEVVTGFELADINVSGGTVTDLSSTGIGEYVASVDASGDGNVTVQVPADAVVDQAGNGNTAAAYNVDIDTTAPMVVISGPASPTNSSTFGVTIDFGESVSGFLASDLSVVNGTVTNLTDDGNGQFTASVSADGDGSVELSVDAGVAIDVAGNENLASALFSVLVDTTAPQASLTGPASPTGDDPFTVTVIFGESVNGFEPSDVNVTGGVVSSLTDLGDGTFEVTIDADADGVVSVDVVAGVASDDAGNFNAAADPLSILVDTTAPQPTITGPDSPTGDDPFSVTIDFGESVSGFDVSDISVTGGTAADFVSNGDGSYSTTIDADENGDISVSIDAGVATDDAGNASAAATLIIAVTANLDFGDAPTGYPVTYEQDGARHLFGSLTLGSQIDIETNGLPSTNADSDGSDEDGVSFITSLVSAGTTTTSSLMVETSGSGKLDAWIDFNQDGDWDDSGEQIFDSVDVATGSSVLSFIVPADASVGETAARFRLSTAGDLSPTGQADDGEVEDYLVTILDADDAPEASTQLTGDPVELTIEAGDVVVRSGQIVRFRAALTDVGSLSIVGSSADESVTLDLTDFATPSGGVLLSGGDGENTLVIGGADGPADLTDPSIDANGLPSIDLTDAAANTLTLDAAAVAKLSPTSKTVEVVAAEGDQLTIREPKKWRLADPVIAGDTFYVTAQYQEGDEQIRANIYRPWQNFLQFSDVNNDGSTSSLDALVIINEIGTGKYLTAGSVLVDPMDVEDWPGYYLDQNGDGKGTALDALRVINSLAVEASGEAEATSLVFWSDAKRESTEELQDERFGLITLSERPTPAKQSHGHALANAIPLAMRSPIDSSAMESTSIDEVLADESFLDDDLMDWLGR